MAPSLRIPRVEVFWGGTNLTFYTEGGQSSGLYGEPLVYNVTANLTENGQTPSGSMLWNPSGAAYKIYEKFVESRTDEIITVRYYYLDGRSISFGFVWSGQQENYGANMDLRVMLSSELDGLTNGILRSTAQADEDGYPMITAIHELEIFFGVEQFKLVDYTPKARQDLSKVKVQSNYNSAMKFYESVESLASNNGNTVFPSNILPPSPKLVIFTPYEWDDIDPVEELSPTAQSPDPRVRYGYFLGPGLIETISKQSQWQTPQKTQNLTINTQQKLHPMPPKTAGAQTETNTEPKKNVGEARNNAKPKPGATSTSHSVGRGKMRLDVNEDGEEKKLLIQKERQCRLNSTLFMCPAFVGMKPYDIIFIPNYGGTYMEDWIINSVEYQQTDGGVNVTVQASRHFGLSDFMNVKEGEKWQAKAKAYGLVGEGATLENWITYGWKPGNSPSSSNNSVSGGTSPPSSSTNNQGSTNGPVRLEVVPYNVSGSTLGESSFTG